MMPEQLPDPTPFIEQARLILDEADKRRLTLRVIGALAFHMHCPEFNYIQQETGRFFTDVDFMAYIEEKIAIEKMFTDMGYLDDPRIKTVPGLKRSIFFTRDKSMYSDVFYDVLEFSHTIDFRGRLEIDHPTISLVDLFLEKMQIYHINNKDVIDTLMLLREHEVGAHEKETVNIDYAAKVCKSDWGLWKTVTTNLEKVDKLADSYDILTDKDRSIIRQRLKRIADRIEEEPPTLRWKLRGRIGERMKWYNDVDEVM
jgi:hypothetical protein